MPDDAATPTCALCRHWRRKAKNRNMGICALCGGTHFASDCCWHWSAPDPRQVGKQIVEEALAEAVATLRGAKGNDDA